MTTIDPKLKKSLTECRKTCVSSLKALPSTATASASSSSSPTPPAPPGVGDAFSGLLVNLRQTTTSLGLAFKPPVSVDAAVQQLDRISDHIGKLISCVILVSDSRVLSEEWKAGIEQIVREITRHAETLGQGGDYLASTGMVWESIDRLLDGLSKDETGAVLRRLKASQGVVQDAWSEFKEILESQGGEDQDDGWDELDLGGEELSDEERRRAEAAKPLLALHQILQATIPRFIDRFEGKHDRLLATTASFVDAYDGAVSAMHPEQDEEEIEEALSELEKVSRELAGMVGDKSMERWVERLETERKKWDERRLDLGSLADAI